MYATRVDLLHRSASRRSRFPRVDSPRGTREPSRRGRRMARPGSRPPGGQQARDHLAVHRPRRVRERACSGPRPACRPRPRRPRTSAPGRSALVDEPPARRAILEVVVRPDRDPVQEPWRPRARRRSSSSPNRGSCTRERGQSVPAAPPAISRPKAGMIPASASRRRTRAFPRRARSRARHRGLMRPRPRGRRAPASPPPRPPVRRMMSRPSWPRPRTRRPTRSDPAGPPRTWGRPPPSPSPEVRIPSTSRYERSRWSSRANAA